MITPQPARYLRSLSDELEAQANRVRDLIGDAHWLHEGRHKEFLLADVIRRHSPGNVIVSTGFVVSPSHASCSAEQDILIVDCRREAPIFNQGGLAMAFPRNVMAAISVKTAFDATTFRSAAKGLLTVKTTAAASGINPTNIWCGAYFFKPSEAKDEELPVSWLEDSAQSAEATVMFNGVSTRCWPVDVFACSSSHAFVVDSRDPATHDARVRGFHCNGLATAVFLAHVVDHLAVAMDATHSEFADFADVDGITPFCSRTLSL